MVRKLRVLAACEFSGMVRDAFIRRGHDAWSADFLPGEGRYKHKHYLGDLVDTLRWEDPFDLIIAFPPARIFPVRALAGSRKSRQMVGNRKPYDLHDG